MMSQGFRDWLRAWIETIVIAALVIGALMIFNAACDPGSW